MRFKEFLENTSYGDIFRLPLGLPETKKTGTILHIAKKKNPIEIYLSDNTKLYLTYDQYRRVQGNPEVGNKIEVVFQRTPIDKTDNPSKIVSITILKN